MPGNNSSLFRLITVVVLSIAINVHGNGGKETKKERQEVSFPNLLSEPLDPSHVLHVKAELIDDKYGYHIVEEFLDPNSGMMATIKSTQGQREVTFADAKRDAYYQYKPFECFVMSRHQFSSLEENRNSLWNYNLNSKSGSSKKWTLQVHGIIALWMKAAETDKSYLQIDDYVNMDTESDDLVEQTHIWSVKDDIAKSQIQMVFLMNSREELLLERIVEKSLLDYQILRTFYIISIEPTKRNSNIDDILQVPVGYGCSDSSMTEKARKNYRVLFNEMLNPLSSQSYKMELEATATKYSISGSATGGQRETEVDTLYAELALSRTGSEKSNFIQLLHERSSGKNIRSLSDHHLKLNYLIDLNRGTCEVNKFPGGAKRDEASLKLKFGNGLDLDLSLGIIQELFVNTKGFQFIKSIRGPVARTEYVYLEQTTTSLLLGKTARIVRTYQVDTEDWFVTIHVSKLKSVTIWILDVLKAHILESYHLNVLSDVQLSSVRDVARVFDISRECYLNNKSKEAGRDYVWLDVTYPLVPSDAEMISREKDALIELVYDQMRTYMGINFFRAPQIEFMLESFELVLRILILDLPQQELLFDVEVDTKIVKGPEEILRSDLAVDLGHCANLCSLEKCQAMSYCWTEKTCIISLRNPQEASSGIEVAETTRCNLYVLPLISGVGQMKYTLSNLISELKFADLSSIKLPGLPQELRGAMSTYNGVNAFSKNANSISNDYVKQFSETLKDEPKPIKAWYLALSDGVRMIVLEPGRFEFELDELDELDTSRRDSLGPVSRSSSELAAAAFHEGKAGHQLSIELLSEKESIKWSSYNGLDYDQCASACLDSGCQLFSFCMQRRECITTERVDKKEVDQFTQLDHDCIVMERDYLSRFREFPAVSEPMIFEEKLDNVQTPSDCAYACYSSTNYNCLAFDFCSDPKSDFINPSCYLLSDRLTFKEASRGVEKANEAEQSETRDMNSKAYRYCNHYSRSHLADFKRLRNIRVSDAELSKLETTTFEGESAEKCANLCLNEIVNCLSFQFCLDTRKKGTSTRECTFIQSSNTRKDELSPSAIHKIIVDDGSGIIRDKMFAASNLCDFFSFRHDSNEARTRSAIMEVATKEEISANEINLKRERKSIISQLMFYIIVSAVFALLTAAVGLLIGDYGSIRLRFDNLMSRLNNQR